LRVKRKPRSAPTNANAKGKTPSGPALIWKRDGYRLGTVAEAAAAVQGGQKASVLGTVDQDPHRLVESLKAGLPVSAFDRLRDELEVTSKELGAITGVALRTLMRRVEKGVLTPAESDRVHRVSRLFDRAVEVLGSAESARRWLKSPARGLGYKVPLAFADTEVGAREVEDLLGRVEHGTFW
jgi:putative toxin-antitoxin system antitoxin component (TIGR02293 family)